MKIILDTCTFLWLTLEPEKMSRPGTAAFQDPSNYIYLSSATSWEICLKYNLGKLPLPVPPKVFIPEERREHQISILNLSEQDIFQLTNLPDIHKDPFDRILICQAIENGLTILTSDSYIHQYPVKTLW